MSISIKLPNKSGKIYTYELNEPLTLDIPKKSFIKRDIYSAAHVVVEPLSDIDPINNSKIDWEATLNYRRYLWSLGFGVAEAMDTAQRGMGLDWEMSKELIERSSKVAKEVDGKTTNDLAKFYPNAKAGLETLTNDKNLKNTGTCLTIDENVKEPGSGANLDVKTWGDAWKEGPLQGLITFPIAFD